MIPNSVMPNPMMPVGAVAPIGAMQPTNPKRLVDRSQPLGRWSHVPPNNTLYVNNLCEKLNRDELVKALKHVFGQFGKILDVVAYTKIKAGKGQAFVVFDEIESATKALQEMNNFLFYHKPLRVSYAKTKSDAVAKRDGSFKPRPPKRKKGDVKDGKMKFNLKGDTKDGVQVDKKLGVKSETTKSTIQTQQKPVLPSNRILLIQNLPKEATENMVTMLFQASPGFQKVSLIPGYAGFAYCEYKDEQLATEAMNSLQGFKITAENQLVITYAPSS